MLVNEKEEFLKLLLPRKPIKVSWHKYLYLEKILLAAQEYKKNTGYYTSSDALKLMVEFNIEKRDLFTAYCNMYELKGYRYDVYSLRPNFYKMLTPRRYPNIILIETLIQLILTGEVLQDVDGKYYSTNARFNRNSLSFNEYCEIDSYVKFCLAISKLEGEYLKPYELEVGIRILEEKAFENIEIVRPILQSGSLLSKYLYPTDIDELEPPYNDYSDFYSNFCEPLPCEASVKTIDYISICNEWQNSDSNIYNYFDDAPNGLLLFLRNYIYMLQELDKNFWQLLFLLQYLSYSDLEILLEYQPQYTFTIKKEHCKDYYKCVKQIIEIPDIEEIFPLSSDVRNEAIKSIILSQKGSQHLPNWSYIVMRNISQQHLTTAKYLYLTLILGYRYRHIEQNYKLPQELLNLFCELNNINIERYIKEIDSLEFDL